MKGVAEKFEEYFNPQTQTQQEPQNKPQFGAPVNGSMPNGDKAPSFGDYWGFNKKKG
jgi:hypothetical protein